MAKQPSGLQMTFKPDLRTIRGDVKRLNKRFTGVWEDFKTKELPKVARDSAKELLEATQKGWLNSKQPGGKKYPGPKDRKSPYWSWKRQKFNPRKPGYALLERTGNLFKNYFSEPTSLKKAKAGQVKIEVGNTASYFSVHEEGIGNVKQRESLPTEDYAQRIITKYFNKGYKRQQARLRNKMKGTARR